MMIHELKCWPEYFQAVKSGAKTFEVRKRDRAYKEGDMLRLREYDPKTLEYSGDEITREIAYLLDMAYLPGDNLPHFAGYVVMGLSLPDGTVALRVENERLRTAHWEIIAILEEEADFLGRMGWKITPDDLRAWASKSRAALEKGFADGSASE
ncbi:MAG: DUF3850 domain-containing protein [Alphaproteobacteria bacterium]|nr:DUF3850 domain-containing protein [Alphaproteobacteria bacterium]